MDNNHNNNNWRGRGRGRGNNNNNSYNNRNNRDYNDNYSNAYNNSNTGGNVPITARLGPAHGPTNDRPNQSNNNHNNHNNQNNRNNYNNNNQRGGRAFSSNNYRGRGNRGNRHGGGGARFNSEFIDEDTDMKPDTTAGNIVTVTGYPAGSEEKVLGFLTRKAKTVWEPLNIEYEHKSMHITVADEIVAEGLCKMNNFNFGNAVLQITRGGSGGEQQGGRSTRGNFNNNSGPRGGGNTGRANSNNSNVGKSAVLVNFLQERWNPQAGFLDMEELPPTSHSITVVISRLLDEAKYLFGDELKTISFARNKLWSVTPLNKVPDVFPNLQNLSIADNEIAEFRSLDKLANRLPHLQELMLSGNPIQSNHSFEQYQQEVLRRFPTIQFLDVQPVNGQPSAQQQLDLPLPVRSNFFDNDSSRIATQDLLSKFFPLFDTNRASLVDLYDAQSIFSVTFSNGTFQQQNAWGSSQVPPAQRMVFGNENIIKRLVQLPATTHDLSSADNFMTDAWQTPGSQNHPVVLFLTVHGGFIESLTGTPLSFDRSFLVAPSTPGSRAQNAGWSYVILNDSLVVRNFSSKPGSLVTA